jgi:regulator of replication initiation timing
MEEAEEEEGGTYFDSRYPETQHTRYHHHHHLQNMMEDNYDNNNGVDEDEQAMIHGSHHDNDVQGPLSIRAHPSQQLHPHSGSQSPSPSPIQLTTSSQSSPTPFHQYHHQQQQQQAIPSLQQLSLKFGPQRADMLMSAVTSLNSYRSFRAHSDRSHKERALEEQLRTEIKKPLADALQEMKSLTAKVARRDEYIVGLRRMVGLEAVATRANSFNNSTGGSLSGRSNTVDAMHESERTQIFNLYDEIDRLESDNKQIATENEKLKRKLATYTQDRKQHYLSLEQQQLATKESIRSIERERDYTSAMVSQRDGMLERITHELARTKEELNISRKKEYDAKTAIEQLMSEAATLNLELRCLRSEVEDKAQQYKELHVLSTAARDKVITVTAENLGLRRK